MNRDFKRKITLNASFAAEIASHGAGKSKKTNNTSFKNYLHRTFIKFQQITYQHELYL